MLIDESIVKNWYKKDSWVYKSFSYLFKNPLWDNEIPRGFSVCPYFWMSLFSLFIFKPFFVFPIRYIIYPIMKVIGTPIDRIDKFLFDKIISEMGSKRNYKPGIASSTIMFLLIVSCGLLLILIGITLIWIYFYKYISFNIENQFIFWSVLSFLIIFIVHTISSFIIESKLKTNRVLFGWVLLFTILSLFFVPSTFISLISFPFILIYKILAASILTDISILLFLFSLVYRKDLTNAIEFAFEDKMNITIYNRRMWINRIKEEMENDSRLKSLRMIDFTEETQKLTGYEYIIAMPGMRDIRNIVFEMVIERIYKEELNYLQSMPPSPGDRCREYDSIFSLDVNREGFNGKDRSRDEIEKVILDIFKEPEISQQVNYLIKKYIKKNKKKYLSKLYKWSIWVGNILSEISHQITIFFSYIWIFIKSIKNRYCPYFRFDNNSKKTIDTAE